MKESQAISALAALSQETRLRIVRFLVEKGPEGASAGDIAEAMDSAASKISFHLSNLVHSGLVQSKRQSRNIIYRVDFAQLGGVINYLLTDCCQDHPDIRSCCEPGKSGPCC